MTVIAMTREMGSLGKDVAALLAEQLGLEVVHHELVERDVAARMQTNDSEVHRFLEGSANLFERWRIDSKKLSHYTAEEILELALRGDVIIRGWGATHLLRGIPHVLSVRVCASMSFRIRVLMERLGIAEEDKARREIERNDAAHERVLQGLFGRGTVDPLGYDMVLNTQRLPVELCAAQIRQAVESRAFDRTPQSDQILLDRLIDARVQDVLAGAASDSTLGRTVQVSVEKGVVKLFGVADSDEAVRIIEDQVRKVPDVVRVDAQLGVLYQRRLG